MVKVISGNRIGKDGRLLIGCSASIFNSKKERILLARRADDGKWSVPGGSMKTGEDFSEACKREVFEETGLDVCVKRLISIYTSPHHLLEYPDGNKWQAVVLHFEAEIVDGKLKTSDETTEFSFFSQSDLNTLDMHGMDRMRVLDSFMGKTETIIHNDFPA
jgi:ADP-ribose pyrophosphatase YjhB (NUDIX family)